MKSMDPTRIGGIILALALCLALSACSAIKLGYNALPTLSYWWLDGYIDFSAEQAPQASGVMAFEAIALKQDGVDFKPVPPRYRTPYFRHIMGGYAEGY